MNFQKHTKSEALSFQIAPMIDIVFLLLCFFMATAVYSQWEREMDITLPSAEHTEVPDRLPGEIIINVQRDGMVTVNRQPLTDAELRRRLQRLADLFPGQPVVIRADRDARYHQIMAVMDACGSADIWNISFATSPDDSEP